MSGSTDLINLRSRGNYKRPFTRVDQIEKAAEEKTSEEESRIMAEIKGFETQLNEKLSALENKEQELINKTILDEKKDIEVELAGSRNAPPGGQNAKGGRQRGPQNPPSQLLHPPPDRSLYWPSP